MNFIEIIKIILYTTIILISILGFILGEHLYRLALDSRTDKSLLLHAPHNRPTKEYLRLPKDELKKALEWFESNARERYIQSFDNLKLHYYIIKNRVPTNKWAIIAHGYNSCAAKHSLNALNFYNMGFNVLTADARGHGKSEGTYIGMGYKDRLDIMMYIDKILNDFSDKTNPPEILLYGCSMGASTVMMTLGEKLPSNVKACIADCGYSSAWEQFSYQLKKIFNLPSIPILNFMSLMTKLHAGYFLENANVKKGLKKAKIPVFLIHGGNDTFVPTHMTEKNYKLINSPKEKLIIKGAGHVESSKVAPEIYWNRVLNFTSKYMR